jgi:carbon-monoxide dehydrogenase small subunit
MPNVTMRINGEAISHDIEARMSLADFLREHANCRSVHLGCEHGVCGACTILIDGRLARSCIALAIALDGAEITTLEGLQSDPVMAQLRESFHERHGLQCGYCTPGMLVTARDIIQRDDEMTEKRLREALAGNICRCTGYAGIVASIQHAADALKQD